MPDPCPGPCNNAFRRAHRAYTTALSAWFDADPTRRGERPEPVTLDPRPGEPVWCLRCTASVRAALSNLDDLAALLEAHNDGHRRLPRADRVSGSAGTPSVSPATETLDELYAALVSVEDIWRHHRGYPTRPHRGRGAHARTATIAWLLAHLDDILTDPGMTGFGTGTLGWQHRLHALTRSTPEDRRRAGRCPRCDMIRTLHHRDDGYTQCRNCGRLLAEGEYHELANQQAAQADGGAA